MDTWRYVFVISDYPAGSSYMRPPSWMFDCCRVPGTDGKDFSVSFAREGDLGNSGYVVVIRNGRFWKLDTATPAGELLGTIELEKCVRGICGPCQLTNPLGDSITFIEIRTGRYLALES